MAHYAFIDENNIVTEVIIGLDETELIEGLEPEVWYSQFRGQVCKRTSYNSKIRKNFAGVGYVYDERLDGFIAPKPFDSWVLDEETCTYISPTPMPDNGKHYDWDEGTESWLEIPSPEVD